MKEFNLDAALNGEPVKLRNGLKAIVYHRIPDEFSYPGGSTEIYPLIGIIFNKDGTLSRAHRKAGKIAALTVLVKVILILSECGKSQRLALKICLSRLSLNIAKNMSISLGIKFSIELV